MHSLSLSWGGRFFCSPSLVQKAGLPPVYFLYTEGRSSVPSFFVNIFPGFTEKKNAKKLEVSNLVGVIFPNKVSPRCASHINKSKIVLTCLI